MAKKKRTGSGGYQSIRISKDSLKELGEIRQRLQDRASLMLKESGIAVDKGPRLTTGFAADSAIHFFHEAMFGEQLLVFERSALEKLKVRWQQQILGEFFADVRVEMTPDGGAVRFWVKGETDAAEQSLETTRQVSREDVQTARAH